MRLQHPPAWLRPPARRRAGAQPWRVVRPPLRSRVGPDSLRHVRLTLTPALALGARDETPGSSGASCFVPQRAVAEKKAAGQDAEISCSPTATRLGGVYPKRKLPKPVLFVDLSLCMTRRARTRARARRASRGHFDGAKSPRIGFPAGTLFELGVVNSLMQVQGRGAKSCMRSPCSPCS